MNPAATRDRWRRRTKRVLRKVSQRLGLEEIHAPGGRDREARRIKQELRRLRSAPDGTVLTTGILGPELHLISNRAFIHLYKEIIDREQYRFTTETASPMIIDCGANIGVSLIYFKSQYPDARILCFEPAPDVFRVLLKNIESFGLENVVPLECGVWDRKARLGFHGDPRSTGGYVASDGDEECSTTVEVVRLRDYLDQRVHFLKLDVEGAESVVVRDISDRLENVDNVFVEYHSRENEKQTLDAILHELTRNGFRLYMESGPQLSPQPFVRCGTYKGLDLLLNIFGVRSR